MNDYDLFFIFIHANAIISPTISQSLPFFSELLHIIHKAYISIFSNLDIASN